MSEQRGDIYYRVYWTFGDDDTSPDCSEDDLAEDKEEMGFELERIKVRSVRQQSKFTNLVLNIVTAYEMVERLTVDRKGNFLPRPYKACIRQWCVGSRPNDIRPTKVGAYAAAIAEIRKDPEFDKNKHAPLVNRLLGQKKRAANA
ncbi:MAG: hypothetical protein ACFHHU_00900 [Porticoccaceae bacterium]